MSEKINFTPEKGEKLRLPDAAHAEKLRPGEADPTKANQDPIKALEEARAKLHETTKAEQQSNPLERFQAAEKAAQPAIPTHVNRELKQITLKRELKQVQRKLPAPERALSKVIHQPAIRAVSETASKSLTRPSGLLGGGLLAFIGSSGYLYLAKHLGFTYNYLIFLLLFAGGFIIGLALEFVVWAATKSDRRSHD